MLYQIKNLSFLFKKDKVSWRGLHLRSSKDMFREKNTDKFDICRKILIEMCAS